MHLHAERQRVWGFPLPAAKSRHGPPLRLWTGSKAPLVQSPAVSHELYPGGRGRVGTAVSVVQRVRESLGPGRAPFYQRGAGPLRDHRGVFRPLCYCHEQPFNLSLSYTNTAWNLSDTTSTNTLRGRW